MAPRPPGSPPPWGGLPPAPPTAVTATVENPGGTTYVCSPPVNGKLAVWAAAGGANSAATIIPTAAGRQTRTPSGPSTLRHARITATPSRAQRVLHASAAGHT